MDRRAQASSLALSAFAILELCWSRPQREIHESFKRGWHDSAPSWAASRRETALPARRARCRGLHDGVDAGRCATGGTRRGSQAHRLRFFRGVQAGSWSLGAARFQRALREPILRETRICAAYAREGSPGRGRRLYFQTLEQRAASENFAQLPVPAKSGSAPARKACSACNLSRRPLSPVTPSCARLRAARPLIYEVLSC